MGLGCDVLKEQSDEAREPAHDIVKVVMQMLEDLEIQDLHLQVVMRMLADPMLDVEITDLQSVQWCGVVWRNVEEKVHMQRMQDLEELVVLLLHLELEVVMRTHVLVVLVLVLRTHVLVVLVLVLLVLVLLVLVLLVLVLVLLDEDL